MEKNKRQSTNIFLERKKRKLKGSRNKLDSDVITLNTFKYDA